MGTSIELFLQARRQKYAWTIGKCFRYLATRGFILILIGFLLTIPDELLKRNRIYLTVMWALGVNLVFAFGVSMMVDSCVELLARPSKRESESFVEDVESTAAVSPRIVDLRSILPLTLIALASALLVQWISPLATEDNMRRHEQGEFQWWQVMSYVVSESSIPWVSALKIFGRYPFLPWLSCTIWGIVLGKWLKQSFARSWRLVLFHSVLAFSCGATFVAIRLVAGFGNTSLPLMPPSQGNPYLVSVIHFLTIVKYPPSLAYLTLTMALVHGILAVLETIAVQSSRPMAPEELSTSLIEDESAPLLPPVKKEPNLIDPILADPDRHILGTSSHYVQLISLSLVRYFTLSVLEVVAILGRSPLFFYIAHFLLFKAFGMVLRLAFPTWNISISGVLLIWLLGVASLVYPCRAYARWKQSKPVESMWRYF